MSIVYWPQRGKEIVPTVTSSTSATSHSYALIGWFLERTELPWTDTPRVILPTLIVAGSVPLVAPTGSGNSRETASLSKHQLADLIQKMKISTQQLTCDCQHKNSYRTCETCLQNVLFESMEPLAVAREPPADPWDSGIQWENKALSLVQKVESLVLFDPSWIYSNQFRDDHADKMSSFQNLILTRLSHADQLVQELSRQIHAKDADCEEKSTAYPGTTDQPYYLTTDSTSLSSQEHRMCATSNSWGACCRNLREGYTPSVYLWLACRPTTAPGTKSTIIRSRFLDHQRRIVLVSYRLRAFTDILALLLSILVLSWNEHRLYQIVTYTYQMHYKILFSTLQELNRFPMGIKLNEKLTQRLGNELDAALRFHERTLTALLGHPGASTVLKMTIFTSLLLGFPIFLSLFQDFWTLCFFHITLLARLFHKLYSLELHLLNSLWLLLRGKKNNVLRQRTDTMKYDATQLLVGIIAFAAALFLFSTVFSYHAVFGILDAGSVLFASVLDWVRHIYHSDAVSRLIVCWSYPTHCVDKVHFVAVNRSPHTNVDMFQLQGGSQLARAPLLFNTFARQISGILLFTTNLVWLKLFAVKTVTTFTAN